MTLTSALFPWIFHARTTRSLQYLFSLFFFYFSPFFSNSLLNLWLFLFISHFLLFLFLFLFPSSIVSSHFRLLSVYRRPRFFPGKIDRFSDLSFDSLSLFKNLSFWLSSESLTISPFSLSFSVLLSHLSLFGPLRVSAYYAFIRFHIQDRAQIEKC